MKFFIIAVLLAAAESRPQNQEMFHPEPSVQIEKQDLIELRSLDGKEKDIDKHTKDILEKIKEVNKQHGYTPKIKLPKDVQPLQHFYAKSTDRKLKEFNFATNPFSNPIMDYINQYPITNERNFNYNNNNNKIKGYYNSYTDNNAEITPEDLNGEVIKRKVTHHQTYMVPNMFQPQSPVGYNNPDPFYENSFRTYNDTNDELQNQSVNNVKNIIGYTLNMPQINPYYNSNPYYYYNPYMNYPSPPMYQPDYSTYYPQQNYAQQNYARQVTLPVPFQELFPIIIRNPFQMMVNAFTSMVEYGQPAQTACGGREEPELEESNLIRSGKLLDKKEKYKTDQSQEETEITIYNILKNKTNEGLVIENLKMPRNKQLPIFRPAAWFNNKAMYPNQNKKNATERLEETNEKDYDDSDEIENLSTKGLFNNPHSNPVRKGSSKDNTGSGIFIHKLKVRKGGVAIAGPGGIATAGSGGTAIVGPNGFAFTHPDSLAIAGSGTKVVAVDPSINLSDLVSNNHNKTRFDGSSPRVGKVVATGPVIYYNKG